MTPKQKAFAIQALRRASIKWYPRNIAKKLARVENPTFTLEKENDRCRIGYRCNDCQGIYRNNNINLDHIVPVVSPDVGFETFDKYIERLYTGVDGWQVLCKECHKIKTFLEKQLWVKKS